MASGYTVRVIGLGLGLELGLGVTSESIYGLSAMVVRVTKG